MNKYLRSRPMIATVAGMIAAILCPLPGFWFYVFAAASVAVLSICIFRRWRVAAYVAAGLMLGSFSAHLNAPALPDVSCYDREDVYRARVERANFGSSHQRCIVMLHGMDAPVRCGLYIREADYELFPGDEIAFRARLRPALRGELPMCASAGQWNRAWGLGATAVTDFDKVELLRADTSLASLPARCSRAIADIIFHSGLSAANADLLAGMVLGESVSDGDMREQFRKSGMAHLLCVSGFHVAMFAAIVLLVLLPLQMNERGSLLRYALTIGAVWFYAAVTGLWPSAVRAALMLSAFLMAKMSCRLTSSLNVLALAVAIMLTYNAFWLYSVSFQLSVCAVAALCVFGKASSVFGKQGTLPHRAGTLLVASAAAALGTMPVLLANFHFIQLQSIGTNFFSGILGPLFMVSGALNSLIAATGAPHGATAWLTDRLGDGLTALARAGSGSSPLGADGIYPDATALLLCVCAIAALAVTLHHRHGKVRLAALTCGMVLFAGAGCSRATVQQGVYVSGDDVIEIRQGSARILHFGHLSRPGRRYRGFIAACAISPDSVSVGAGSDEDLRRIIGEGPDIVVLTRRDRTPADSLAATGVHIVVLETQPDGRRAELSRAFADCPNRLHDCLYGPAMLTPEGVRGPRR